MVIGLTNDRDPAFYADTKITVKQKLGILEQGLFIIRKKAR